MGHVLPRGGGQVVPGVERVRGVRLVRLQSPLQRRVVPVAEGARRRARHVVVARLLHEHARVQQTCVQDSTA